MQVAKWGNSLAIRLPAAVVEALELKEDIRSRFWSPAIGSLPCRDRSKQKAIERLRRVRRSLPGGFTFRREEASER